MSCGGCCPDRPIVTDEVCQNWETECNNQLYTLWEADGDLIKPFGTVTILVENSCDRVEIFINGGTNAVATIKEGQSFSKTFSNLRKVAVKCLTSPRTATPVGTCCGKLCMTVHYKKC
ncbi:DUF3992 domain-containing protein [Anoxybacillus flavithermus]|uniref:DUF3992 domain-containing protein n=1 Tax=Anoxybacillus flavithermus TaxID=33934 RepID=UPI000554FD4F|nr:S-Ena type endospore appendage [Anoxybacillus flavithermus]